MKKIDGNKFVKKNKKNSNKKSLKKKTTCTRDASNSIFSNDNHFSKNTNSQGKSIYTEKDRPQPFERDSTKNNASNSVYKDLDEKTTIFEKYDIVITQMSQIVKEQRDLELLLAKLKESTHYLGQAIRKATIYKASLKLIDLWKIMKKAPDEQSQYYSNVIYESLIELGLDAIVPNPGDTYNPVFHQKYDNSSTSDIILSCKNYDWGWKIEDTVLLKAIVRTSCEDTNGNN